MIRDLFVYIASYLGIFASAFYVLSMIEDRKKKEPDFPAKAPKVSIIIPAFNEEKGIAGTITSALNIDYPKDKLEVIIIDDGSSDNTYQIASKFKSKRVKVLTQKNKGKGAAMNAGIKNSSGEFIVTMDADNTSVCPDALKKMIALFQNSQVMCVAPSIAIYNPKGILQRIQQIEYLFGVFLRKAFSSLNAVHITPGAFSAYRKEFFDKHGLFDENNLTEDMEMSLRIQSNNFIIKTSISAVVYTVAPKKFSLLLKQRRRWSVGLLKNLWNYKKLFSSKYGALGTIVLPTAIVSIFLSVILTSYIVITSMMELKKELMFLSSINFNVFNSFTFNNYVINRYIFMIISKPTTLFVITLLLVVLGYLFFAKTKVKKFSNIKLSYPIFIALYGFLFTFWWIVSFIYTIFNRRVSWR